MVLPRHEFLLLGAGVLIGCGRSESGREGTPGGGAAPQGLIPVVAPVGMLADPKATGCSAKSDL